MLRVGNQAARRAAGCHDFQVKRKAQNHRHCFVNTRIGNQGSPSIYENQALESIVKC
jgi:hypothetical protein